jgi:hypothetical protein
MKEAPILALQPYVFNFSSRPFQQQLSRIVGIFPPIHEAIHDSWDPYDFLASINAISNLTLESHRGGFEMLQWFVQGDKEREFSLKGELMLCSKFCLQVPQYAFDIVDSFMQK